MLYVGITNNLKRRIGEHTADRGKWATFAGRYYCHRLIYYETYNRVIDAIRREKEIKDNRTDKEKIASKGFDVKTSFRNM